MKASEVIKRLETLIQEYGDQPVIHGDCCGDVITQSIAVYAEDNNPPVEKSDAVEFYMH